MTLETWAIFVLVALGPAVSPGPALLLTLTNALRYGPRAVVWSAAANSTGLVLVSLAVALGLSALLAASTIGFAALKVIGAGYLIWLGIKVLRDRRGFVPDGGAAGAGGGQPVPAHLFRQALLVALTNPKALVLIAALLPPFLDPARPLLAQAAVLAVTYSVLCFLVHIGVGLIAGRVRPWLASNRGARMVRRTLGGLFIGFGAALAAGR